MSKEDFFASLPGDELAAAELSLREIILESAEVGRLSGTPPTVTSLRNDPKVSQISQTLLPRSVDLKDWIDHRIGGEVELVKDARDQFAVYIRGTVPSQQSREQRQGAQPKGKSAKGRQTEEEFLKALPQDEHTDQE